MWRKIKFRIGVRIRYTDKLASLATLSTKAIAAKGGN